MFEQLPQDYTQAYDWQWSDWQPYYDALVATELTPNTIETWLGNWDAVQRLFYEVYARLEVATTVDTTDEAALARHQHFMGTIMPEVRKIDFLLNQKLVESQLAPAVIAIPMRNVEAQIRIFNEDNVVLFAQMSELDTRYNQLAGAQTVEWEGEEQTLVQMQVHLKNPDRSVRERAWHAIQARVRQDRDAYNALWRDYMALRQQIYQNAGFNDYREYAWLDRGRHDYSPEQALAFTQAIADVVVPIRERHLQQMAQQMGLEQLKPWDIAVDPQGRDPLQAYESVPAFINTSERVFQQIDPELGSQFTLMKDEGLLDLENRKGKAPGGYCTYFSQSERPFIFMNAVGLADDVTTLLHEAGHSFHGLARRDAQYNLERDVPMEFAEVASMAMELLATPYLSDDHDGYFDQADTTRYCLDHLRDIVTFLPYMAVVVEFQHWIYTHHEQASDPDQCDAQWLKVWHKFMTGFDYSGYEEQVKNRWRRQLHIFQLPFYYIEYGLAQFGAIQVWANARRDQAKALQQYREALALGGTVALPDLFATAGAQLPFNTAVVREAITLVDEQIRALEAQA